MKYIEIKAGMIIGGITLLLFFVMHQIEPRWMLHPGLYWGSLIIYFLGMLGACLLIKRQGNGVLPFRKAVRSAFITFIVANVLFFVFYYFMFNVYDPNLPVLQKELAKIYLEENYIANDLRRELKALEEADYSVGVNTLFYGLASGAIGGFILSLLIALGVQQRA